MRVAVGERRVALGREGVVERGKGWDGGLTRVVEDEGVGEDMVREGGGEGGTKAAWAGRSEGGQMCPGWVGLISKAGEDLLGCGHGRRAGMANDQPGGWRVY